MKTMRGNAWITTLSLVCFTSGLFMCLVPRVQGGHCFHRIGADSTCTGLISTDIERDACCSNRLAVAYSEDVLPRGMVFFADNLKRKVQCVPCSVKTSHYSGGKFAHQDAWPEERMPLDEPIKCSECSGGGMCTEETTGRQMRCPNDETLWPSSCKIPCKGAARSGRVCGSDGRTYSKMCHLQRRMCRSRKDVRFAHLGPCSDEERPSSVRSDIDRLIVKSCNDCRAPKTCVLDQNKVAYCLKCDLSGMCDDTSGSPVCGSDGVTYPSKCRLHATACARGGSIQIAKEGAC